MSKEISFDIDRAIELFEQCPSWRKVARELGVHPFSLQSKLRSLGYKADRDAVNKKPWSDAASELRKEKLTYEQIGLKLGVTTSAVQREMVKKHGRGGKP